MDQNKAPQYCFCTLALGKPYNALANLLAEDIARHAPHTKLVLLTDRPQNFTQLPQVIAIKHQQQGVKCYHDKRFAIEQALVRFNACIFLDSDMRILESVPEQLDWLVPGIKARACFSMIKKFVAVEAGTADKRLNQEFHLAKEATQNLGLDLNAESLQFVHEYLFAITKDNGKEEMFIHQWGKLAQRYEQSGIYDAEGYAIGLAAAKAGITIQWDEMPGIEFFNNKIEQVKIRQGQVSADTTASYFAAHRAILPENVSLSTRLRSKLKRLAIGQ